MWPKRCRSFYDRLAQILSKMSKVDINTGTFVVQEDDLVVHTVTFDAFLSHSGTFLSHLAFLYHDISRSSDSYAQKRIKERSFIYIYFQW